MLSYPFIDHYSNYFFLPCYIHLSHGGYCTAIVFNGIDSVFITTCFHISAQFQIITMKIRKAFKAPEQDDTFTVAENQTIRKSLIDVIEEQNQLFDLTDLFIEVFSFIILMHFTSVALIIGIGSIDFLMVNVWYFFSTKEKIKTKRILNVFQAPESDKALYLVYILTVMIQSFAYAFSGHQICEHVKSSLE